MNLEQFGEWLSTTQRFHYGELIALKGDIRVPDAPGLYVWGADRTVDKKHCLVPRYVGMSKSSLRKRIFNYYGKWSRGVGRYVFASTARQEGVIEEFPTQGSLACQYHDKIRSKFGGITNEGYSGQLKPLGSERSPVKQGLEAFEPGLVEKFRNKAGTDLRLRHAVDWALHGGSNLQYLWVAFPTIPPGLRDGQLKQCETLFIRVASAWNKENKLPPLMNDRGS